MKMEVAHVGRTGKDSTITFDTDRKLFTRGRMEHDVYIYAERTADVNYIINDLKRINYREVSLEEFAK